jgi:tetratricopeptide (TPR) repeat protein
VATLSWLRSKLAQGVSRPRRVVALLATAVLGGVGFLPLFGGPGYEASLAAGLVLPSLVALAVAWEVARERPAPLLALGRGIEFGFALAVWAFTIAVLHGLRSGFCDFWRDAALFALGGGAGAVMGGAWGALSGTFATLLPRRQRLGAALLALAGPFGGILISLLRFHSTPMVYAFDPFFGYFAGPLYDTVIGGLDRLVSYRVGSLFGVLALLGASAHLEREPEHGRLRWVGRPSWQAWGTLVLASGALSVFLTGPRLGHRSTSESIRATLGRAVSGERCEVVFASSLPEREAALVLRECEAHVRELEAWFGVSVSRRITTFLFASPAEKGLLTGASRTQIAKPWRHEIYIQAAPYPHPVLRHELAHVVAGEFGRGPFRIAGPLGGWIPDPGRIEGVAEAAAPDDDGELTLDEWARTMQELELLPPLSRVFRLAFLAESAQKAYTVAGAFVSFLRQTYGAESVRRWYAGEPLESVTELPFDELERRWHAALRKVAVTPAMKHAAELRFDRPGVFARRCPRVVDSLLGEAGGLLGGADVAGAEARYREVLELDPSDYGARVGLAVCSARSERTDEARKRFGALAEDARLGRAQRAFVLERWADLELRAGQLAAARAKLEAVKETTVDEDRLRSLELKLGAADSPLERDAILTLLVGLPGRPPEFAPAAARLGVWLEREPEDGTPAYLLGKNFYNAGLHAEAAQYLDLALERDLASERVKQEALRVRLLAACALGDRRRAREILERWARDAAPHVRHALDLGTRAVARRCGVSG